jgi:hypothetical protein
MERKSLWSKILSIVLIIITLCLGVVLPPPAQAAESGTGVYPLGYQSSMAGFLPPPGFYLRNDFYAYQGTARILPLSGLLEANLRARYVIDMVNGTVVTPWKILGANYAAGIIWAAVNNTFIKGQVDIANRLSVSREGDRTDFGDLVISPLILGWHKGPWHITFVGNVYAPSGTYNRNRIVNTSLNRWAIEPNVGITYLHPEKGHEVSAYLGYTINFENPATNYTTGNELHLEWFAGQHFTKWFALGLVGYFYQQVTGDSGSGARLGAFQGQTLALGPCVTLNDTIGKHPIGVNLRYYDELTVTNRLNGQSFWVTLTFGF